MEILTRLRCCPSRAGQIAKAILVSQAHEVKTGMKRLIIPTILSVMAYSTCAQ